MTIKNKDKLSQIRDALEDLLNDTTEALEIDDQELNGPNDVYAQIQDTITSIDTIL